MNYLLIGGAGYIGSHIKEQIIKNKKHGDKIIIFDNFSTGFTSFTADADQVIEGDFTNYEALEVVFDKNKIDVVILLAAKIAVGESVKKPIEYYQNNLIGAINTLNCIKKFNVPKLIFSSTAAVYGLGNNIPLKETDPTNPINPYGYGKLTVERMIIDLAATINLKYVILRYFNVAGASDSLKIGYLTKDVKSITHIVPSISSSVFKIKDALQIFGDDYATNDGTCVRDYVHVVDLADAHLQAVNYLENNDSNIFNVGSKNGYSVLEIVKAFEKGNNIKVDYAIGKRRAGDPDFLVADSNKIRTMMNFKPQFNLEDIVKSEYQWREHIIKNAIK